MTDRTQYLLALAKRTVNPYIANPKTKAVMVTGSVEKGYVMNTLIAMSAFTMINSRLKLNYSLRVNKIKVQS